jgi:hypothetical protein
VKVLLLHAELVESKRDDLGMGPVKLGVGKERCGGVMLVKLGTDNWRNPFPILCVNPVWSSVASTARTFCTVSFPGNFIRCN